MHAGGGLRRGHRSTQIRGMAARRGQCAHAREARFATTRRISGAERTTIQQITRNDPPHGWAARGIDGPIRPNATITVEPVNGGTRSRVTFTWTSKATESAFPCYRSYASRRTRALQIATGTSRTSSNAASELMPRIRRTRTSWPLRARATRLVLRKVSPCSRAVAASNDPGSITAAVGQAESDASTCRSPGLSVPTSSHAQSRRIYPRRL